MGMRILKMKCRGRNTVINNVKLKAIVEDNIRTIDRELAAELEIYIKTLFNYLKEFGWKLKYRNPYYVLHNLMLSLLLFLKKSFMLQITVNLFEKQNL